MQSGWQLCHLEVLPGLVVVALRGERETGDLGQQMGGLCQGNRMCYLHFMFLHHCRRL